MVKVYRVDDNDDVCVDAVKFDQYDDADTDVDTSIMEFLDDDDQLEDEPIQYQHSHKFGHDESKCCNLHPCSFCGKANHLS